MDRSRIFGLATAFLGFSLGVMTNVGPDAAEANFCQWVDLVTDASESCLHGVTGSELQLLSLTLMVAGVGWFLRGPLKNLVRKGHDFAKPYLSERDIKWWALTIVVLSLLSLWWLSTLHDLRAFGIILALIALGALTLSALAATSIVSIKIGKTPAPMSLRERAIKDGLIPPGWKSGDPLAAPGGHDADDTLHATGVVHGGKLRLELPRGEEVQRFIDDRIFPMSPNKIGHDEKDVLIAIVNDDFHETVDDVVAKIVSYGPAENPSVRHALGTSLETVDSSTSIHPRARSMFRLALERTEHSNPPVRRFFLGSERGQELRPGAYLIRVAYAGRNHSENSELFELRVMPTGFGVGPKVIR